MKLAQLKADLAKYKAMLAAKMKNFRGVKHESSLSELRYTEVMVLRDIVRSLEKEIANLIAEKALKEDEEGKSIKWEFKNKKQK